VAKDVEAFTSDQAALLLSVADQCPLTGGNAVFRARALYSLIDDTREYDDMLLCLAQGLLTKRFADSAPMLCHVVPNPADDQATLVLPAPLVESARLLLTNAMGAEVMRLQVPADQSRFSFSTRGLVPGIYHYTVLNPMGVIGGGRLAIER
jgi:hypothetical protein